VGGAAEIAVSSGGVTATTVGGDLSVRCSYGTVRASDVRGALRVEASSTGVEVKRIGRSVDVETSYAGVDISGAGGAVNVRNESGAVRVRGLSDAALSGSHAVETSYADIEFVWPQRPGLSYRLESTYGRIDCSFPGTVSERGSRSTLEGSTGSGEASVSLQAKSGSVRLRSE
jgi:hypothetical protein